MFDAHFVSHVVALALDIARQQRNEDHLQPPDVLLKKFNAECDELEHAQDVWDEIPDIVYYATCLQAQGEEGYDRLVDAYLCGISKRYKSYITMEQAKAACLAKYQLRAAGEPKNIENERAAIMAAIGGK